MPSLDNRKQLPTDVLLQAAHAIRESTDRLYAKIEEYFNNINTQGYVSAPLNMFVGQDVPIPPYVVLLIITNPFGAALNFNLGAVAHSVPKNQVVKYATGKINYITQIANADAVGGIAGYVQMFSRTDVGNAQSTGAGIQ